MAALFPVSDVVLMYFC